MCECLNLGGQSITYEGRSLFYLFGLRGAKMERISEIL